MFLEVGKGLVHSPPSREKAAALLVKAACVNLLQDESMLSSEQPPPTNDFHVNGIPRFNHMSSIKAGLVRHKLQASWAPRTEEKKQGVMMQFVHIWDELS